MDFCDSYKRWPKFHEVRIWSDNIKELGKDCAWLFDGVREELPIDIMNRVRTNIGNDCTDVHNVAINIIFDDSASVTVEFLESAIKYQVKNFYDVINTLLQNSVLQQYHPILKISKIELKNAVELRWQIIRQFVMLDMFIPVIIEDEQQGDEIINCFLAEGEVLIRKIFEKGRKTLYEIENLVRGQSDYQTTRTSSSSSRKKTQVGEINPVGQDKPCVSDINISPDSSREIQHEPKFKKEEIDDIMVVLGCLNSVYSKL